MDSHTTSLTEFDGVVLPRQTKRAHQAAYTHLTMRFSSMSHLGNGLRYARTGSDSLSRELPIASESPGQPPTGSEPNQACPSSSELIRAETDVFKFDRGFLPGQRRWFEGVGPLRIWEKSRASAQRRPRPTSAQPGSGGGDSRPTI